MSKQTPIKWRDRDHEKLKREIKNFNARVAYAAKKDPAAAQYLPQPMQYRAALTRIGTRDDYNRLINSMQRFNAKTAETVQTGNYGTSTKWAQREKSIRKAAETRSQNRTADYQPSKEERAALNKAIRSFNAAVDTIRKTDPNNTRLPARRTLKSVLDSVSSPEQLQTRIKHLQEFNAENAKVIRSKRSAYATQWEIDEVKQYEREMNEFRRADRERILESEALQAGEGLGAKRKEMGSLKEVSLRDSDRKFENMSRKDWERFAAMAEHSISKAYFDEKKRLMRENYIAGLRNQNILDADKGLETLIRSVDLDTFLDTVELDSTATFFFYRDDNIEFNAKLENMRAAWEHAAEVSKAKG